MDKSIMAYQQSQSLDSSLKNLITCQMQILKSQIYMGDYTEAKNSFDKVSENLSAAGKTPDEKQLFYGGVIHLYMKDTVEARELFDSAYTVNRESVWTTFGLAYKAYLENNREKLLATAEELESRDIVDGERRYRMVHFYTLGGKIPEALNHLKKSVEGGFFNYPYITSDPLTINLREESKFREITESANKRYETFRHLK
jgi:tetratricopeptide (TPR) repeat protein